MSIDACDLFKINQTNPYLLVGWHTMAGFLCQKKNISEAVLDSITKKNRLKFFIYLTDLSDLLENREEKHLGNESRMFTTLQ